MQHLFFIAKYNINIYIYMYIYTVFQKHGIINISIIFSLLLLFTIFFGYNNYFYRSYRLRTKRIGGIMADIEDDMFYRQI